MLNGDVIFGLASIVFSLLFILSSLGFENRTTDGSPGAGFFPILIGSILLIMGVAFAVSGFKTKKHYFEMNEEVKKNLKIFFLTIAAIIGYLMIWKWISFVVATFAFLIGLNYIYKQSLKFNLIFSSVASLLVYVIFEKIFHVLFIL